MKLDKQETLSTLFANQMLTVVASYAKLLESEITAPQYYMLQTLAREDGMTVSQFASLLDVSLPAVTNLSNKLVSKGYAEREMSEADRRQVLLRITDAGRAFEKRMLDKYKELTSGMWDGFSDTEMDLLIEAYRKMSAHLQSKI
ncbi:MarR family transcriptional regulator [Cohnella rhizosphaerae]|uniref:MarR family transcriptional regulator n=1 Tax=Cohnella rhizosphaerae TaxID=1457232 RepID=A0A9X4KTN4_9BACL|nr:MarR family transcriptional regulator [Cohnella rhizosphaerae]MDG0808012.1 MarR family transcriptional regulator [Cohnella rhizosphaerae]